MNRTLDDYEHLAIRGLDLRHVALCLAASGWRKGLDIGSRATVWTRGEQEIFLPMRQDYADFRLSMFELLCDLERCERRPKQDILRALLLAPFDVVTVAVDMTEDAHMDDLMDDGSGPAAAIRQLLAAAGVPAEADPRPYRPGAGHAPDAVAAYLEARRRAAANRRTLMLSARSRTPAGRGAALALARALSDLHAGINPHGINPHGINPQGIDSSGINPGAISPAGGDGIDDAVRAALAALGMNRQVHRVTIGFAWSPLLSPRPGGARFAFHGGMLPAIAAAGRARDAAVPRHDHAALAAMAP